MIDADMLSLVVQFGLAQRISEVDIEVGSSISFHFDDEESCPGYFSFYWCKKGDFEM